MALKPEIAARNLADAEAFAAKFPNLKVSACGTLAGAMAAHHNAATGWGFTCEFITNDAGVDCLHAWVEAVGLATEADKVAAAFKTIVGE